MWCAVGDDNDFTVTVWDMKGTKLASLSADKDPNKVFGVSWKNESEFVTVGVKHIFFWKFDGAKLTKTKGKCAGKFEMQTFFTATWTQGGHCAAATRYVACLVALFFVFFLFFFSFCFFEC